MCRRLALPLLALALLALTGCALSRGQIRRADAVLALAADRTVTCARADACAEPSPLLDLARQALADSTPQHPEHYVAMLDVGEDALAARINLIRAARRSIDIQTYIWVDDDAGQLVLDELVRAARRGVHVRILADQLFSFSDPAWLARLARTHANLEIRLYNPTFDEAGTGPIEFAAGIVCCFSTFNQRMHNKLLLVDDAAGITGGRNYQNDYYDWNERYDYRDRDVLVMGPAARAMAASFEAFWNHPRAVPLTHLRDVNARILAEGAEAPAWGPPVYTKPERVARLSAAAEDPVYLQQHLLAHVFKVGRVDYFSDLPNKPLEPDVEEERELTRHIMGLVGGARREVVMQTPYLVISGRARRLFRELRRDHPGLRVIVSTNSLAATDAFPVYALYHKHKKRYLKHYGFEIHEFKPHPAEAPLLVAHYEELTGEGAEQGTGTGSHGSRTGRVPLKTGGLRMGLHAKSIVIDGRVALIGSHNFDPRSDHYNTESGVIVYDEAFAADVRASILRDTAPENAWVVAKRPHIPVLSKISNAIGDLSAALPLFDLWPFRYATSYELNPGCQPMSPFDPKFQQCYTPVGDFPEVDLPLKSIYTRILTAFGAGLTGIL